MGTGVPQERAKFDIAGPISLQAGESKLIETTIPLNFTEGINQQSATDPNIQAAANIMDKIGSAISTVNALSGKEYRYWVTVRADVEGISFDPADRIDVKLLSPGEISLGGYRQRF